MADPTLSASWMNDGTISGQGGADPGFDAFMTNLAKQGAQADWQSVFGDADPSTIDPAKKQAWLDQQTQHDYQEVGEGNQGKTLFGMYQNGLTSDMVNKAGQTYTPPADMPSRYLEMGGDSGGYQVANPEWDKWAQDNPQAAAQYNQQSLGGQGGVAQPLFNHSSQTGADTGNFWFDPQHGFLTSPTNFHNGGWEKVGQYLPEAIMAAGSALTMNPGMLGEAFAGSGLGAAGGLFKAGEGYLQNGQINPLSLAGSAVGAFGGQLGLPSMGDMVGGMGIPAQAMQFMPQILQVAMGKGINPVQLALSLAKSGALSGGK